MTPTRWIWVALVSVWGLFFGWYTNLGGPLTEDEIERYLALLAATEPVPAPEDLARLRAFMEQDTGDDFVMLNVLDVYETAPPVEGVEPGQSGEAVLAHYSEYVIPALFSRASHPVFLGTAAAPAMDLMNAPGMEVWGSGVGMRYRSRRDMLDFATDPRFAPAHKFKVAALRKTIAFPLDPWFHFGDLRVLLGLLFATIGCAASWWLASRRGAQEARAVEPTVDPGGVGLPEPRLQRTGEERR